MCYICAFFAKCCKRASAAVNTLTTELFINSMQQIYNQSPDGSIVEGQMIFSTH